MKKNKIVILFSILAIFCLSFYLRIYRLEKNVPSLYVDEVSGSYNSTIPSYTQYANPLDLSEGLLSKISHFTWIFGLTPLGARSASAFYGSFICIVIHLLTLEISKTIQPAKKLSIALLSGIFAAVLPWSFMISRIGHSAVPIAVLLVCLHLLILIKSRKTIHYLLSLIPLGLSVLYYPSLVVIAPLATLLVFYLLTKELGKKQKSIWYLTFIVVLSTLTIIGISRYQILNPKTRGLDLAIWRDVNVTADFNYYRGLSSQSKPSIFSFFINPDTANKVYFNYPLSVVHVFVKNYLSFFSPDFLFLKGDNILRHSTGTVGEFFPYLIPFMLLGVLEFFKKANHKIKTIFILWILVSPIPAAITKDGGTYLLRVITLMPFLTYFCVLGLVTSFTIFKKTYLKIIYGFLISVLGLFAVYYFFFGYFHVYPAISAPSWEFGFKEISDFQINNPGKLLIVWEDKYPVWYFCFWQKQPGDVCNQNKMNSSELINDTRVDIPSSVLLFSLPKSQKDLNLIIDKYKPNFVVIPIQYEKYFPSIEKERKLIETIKYPDQTTSFSIYKINN